MIVLTICSTKGGVGKTTLTANLAGFLAADLLLSPIPPEVLSAREFARGTLGMLDRLRPMGHLGAPIGHLHDLIHRMDRTIDLTEVANTLRRATFGESRGGISILSTVVRAGLRHAQRGTLPLGFEPDQTRLSCKISPGYWPALLAPQPP